MVCWLLSTSVLKRDSSYSRISPMRPVFSRLLTRISHPAGRQWLSRSRRLFHLFPKCNPPCVQVCHVFTCYAHPMAARLGPVSPPCNARGPATPTALHVGVDSSWDDPSKMKRDGASGSHGVGYGGDPLLNRAEKYDANTHYDRLDSCASCCTCTFVAARMRRRIVS